LAGLALSPAWRGGEEGRTGQGREGGGGEGEGAVVDGGGVAGEEREETAPTAKERGRRQ